MPYASGDPNALLAPVGELVPALFPLVTGQALTDMLAAWLDEGFSRATDAGVTDTVKADKAAQAYAYARAYSAALQRIVANPTTEALVDKGSSSYSTKQLDILQGNVDRWQAEYDALVVPPDVATQRTAHPSGASRTTFVW